MKLLNQWVKPQLHSYCPHFALHLLLQIRAFDAQWPAPQFTTHDYPWDSDKESHGEKERFRLWTPHSAAGFLSMQAPHSDCNINSLFWSYICVVKPRHIA